MDEILYRMSGAEDQNEEEDLDKKDTDADDTESDEDETSDEEDTEKKDKDDSDDTDEEDSDEEESEEDDTEDKSDDSNDSEETVESLNAKLSQERKARKDQQLRAEKAERLLKEKGKKKESKDSDSKSDLSSKDIIAITNAKIHEDDIDDVVDYAKFKKISVAEALKSPILKQTLKAKAEERQTGDTTNTRKNRGGTAKKSGDALLDKASKTGELPGDDAGMDAVIDARHKRMGQRR